MRSQFRYARESFRRSVTTAVGLTMIVSFLIWLFLRLFGMTHAGFITAIAGAVFFSFCSIVMIWRYAANQVVLAVRPDGLLDRRHISEPIPWSNIKELRLLRSEDDFRVAISLWPDVRSGAVPSDRTTDYVLDLSPLDADAGHIVESLQRYKPVALDV